MIESWAASDTGLVRSNNEDSFAREPDLGLYAVADGLGGAAAGECASRTAVQVLVEEVRAAEDAATAETLSEIVELMNRSVIRESEADPRLQGMATTITAAVLRDGKALIVNAGDSRAYRFRDGRLECLTEDHTLVQQLAKDEGKTLEDFKDHPWRHMLTKAVGADKIVEPDHFEDDFRPGDILLLSTDGLHGVVRDEEIAKILGSACPVSDKVRKLIAVTLDEEHGAPDNVTVVAVHNRGA